jgi:hypothetical protein
MGCSKQITKAVENFHRCSIRTTFAEPAYAGFVRLGSPPRPPRGCRAQLNTMTPALAARAGVVSLVCTQKSPCTERATARQRLQIVRLQRQCVESRFWRTSGLLPTLGGALWANAVAEKLIAARSSKTLTVISPSPSGQPRSLSSLPCCRFWGCRL